MKTTLSILMSLATVCSAQTLKPEVAKETDDFPESLLESSTSDTKADSVSEENGKASEAQDPEMEQTDQKLEETVDEGIQIQVEKSSKASGANTPTGEVKIYSPWPSKPLFPAPQGWKFTPAPKGIKPYRTAVKLSSGREVNLAITPFVLTPEANGFTSVSIKEPGYDPELGYDQSHTVGAMLRKSTADIEENERQAAESIRRLQQLLTSLPRPVASQSPSTTEETSNSNPLGQPQQ